MTNYTIELNDKQLNVIHHALEEYFRLRMGQEFDFCTDIASLNCDLSPDNPKHEWIFDMYIARRDHLQELMRAFFRIAFEPSGYLNEKTDDMLIAEDIWDATVFMWILHTLSPCLGSIPKKILRISSHFL